MKPISPDSTPFSAASISRPHGSVRLERAGTTAESAPPAGGVRPDVAVRVVRELRQVFNPQIRNGSSSSGMAHFNQPNPSSRVSAASYARAGARGVETWAGSVTIAARLGVAGTCANPADDTPAAAA